MGRRLRSRAGSTPLPDTSPSPSANPPTPALGACRSVGLLSGSAMSYAAIPIIYVVMILLRASCIAVFNLTFFRWLKESELGGREGGRWPGGRAGGAGRCGGKWKGEERSGAGSIKCNAWASQQAHPTPEGSQRTLEHMLTPTCLLSAAALTWAEVAFSGWAGLRGSVSLIMIAGEPPFTGCDPSPTSARQAQRVQAYCRASSVQVGVPGVTGSASLQKKSCLALPPYLCRLFELQHHHAHQRH